MTIELDKETRTAAIDSISRYFDEELDQKLGNIGAGALLGFFLEEIAPSVYNRAVADVQERMLARIQDLDIECHEEPFDYWRKREREQRARKR